MFSLFRKVVTSIIPWNTDLEEGDLNDEERVLVDSIQKLNKKTEAAEHDDTEEPKIIGQGDPVCVSVENFNIQHKTGKITHMCSDCCLIDDVVYFEPNRIESGLWLKVGDEVHYSSFKARENESDRVFSVYAVKNDLSNSDSATGLLELQKPEVIPVISRVVTGRVTERRGREVYIDSAKIWCNLDHINASYVPVEGDWVEISAVVSVNEDSADLTGSVLNVKSLKPLLFKSGFGRVTLWIEAKKEGVIENNIYFTNVACEDGYIPTFGDEVIYDAIESDQGRFRWRALKVFVSSVKTEDKETLSSKTSSINGINDPFGDKNGISIVPSVCSVEIELNQRKRIVLEVTNNGTVEQLFKHTKFKGNSEPQVVLLQPKDNNFSIRPKESVVYEFECEGKHLGLAEYVLYFHFKDFIIAKTLEISVVSNQEMNKFLTCRFDTILKVYKPTNLSRSEVEADMVLYGSKPWKPPKFVAGERKCIFKIPKKLWDIMENDTRPQKRIKALLGYAPYLKSDLNFEHYADRFHTLLHLEEINLKINFRKYDMNGIFLKEHQDLYSLEVPGLVECRPSLMVGDKIVLSQSWAKDSKTKYVGFIHEIQEKEVLVKFHSSFYTHYDGSECDVVFEPSSSLFSRCHEAVNRAVKVLGREWLFPSAVNEKQPLIDFRVAEEEETASEYVSKRPRKKNNQKSGSAAQRVNEIKGCLKVDADGAPREKIKSLVWLNKGLNERQKLAVVSVLKGKGRPLPYIIFGPPGTGKTVTLVEIIIQIYRLLPESRVLITTPSNSAADLICERLINLGNFKPGQLVRLMALYRVVEGMVPVNLIPYSTFYRPEEFLGRNSPDENFKNKIRASSLSELAGKHRITVATCVTIGVLHYAGISPGHFTHVIVDEAGQTTEPEVLITASFQNTKKGQVILAGDPQQLGPVVCSNVAKRFGLGTSLLQRLISMFPYCQDLNGFPDTSGYDPRFITKINRNYRCVPEILSLPSQMFYDSDLIATLSQTEGEEAEIIKKCNFQMENRTTPAAIIFHGIVGQNHQDTDSPSWFNPHEIWQVVFYVRKLYSLGLNCDHVGIVTPYARQVKKLKQLLTSLELSLPKIGSVEEFQGQERHVIIVSTVRSSPKHVPSDIIHSLGFVACPQRLNVSLTRARALLIIIGNPFLLSKDPYWVNVVKYCMKNKSYTGCSLDSAGNDIFGKTEEESESNKENEKVNSNMSDN